jgi:hypothetical protein
VTAVHHQQRIADDFDHDHPSEESLGLLLHRCLYLSCPLAGTALILFFGIRYLLTAAAVGAVE